MVLQTIISKQVIDSQSALLIQAASLDETVAPHIPKQIETIWRQLATIIKFDRHLVYMRDIKEQSIEGKWIGGYAPNGKEVFINLPSWDIAENELINALAHELHHLARWQNGGYGRALGRALITEGMACWFAEIQSGWEAPWTKGEPSSNEIKRAIKEWNSEDYNHFEWFFKGPLGKWAGYRLGYQLARRMLDGTFDIKKSVLADESEAQKLLVTS